MTPHGEAYLPYGNPYAEGGPCERCRRRDRPIEFHEGWICEECFTAPRRRLERAEAAARDFAKELKALDGS